MSTATTTLKKPIAILGGTFDPIHNGHLRLAVQMRDHLGLERMLLVPSARPPHRRVPGATPGQRAKWIRVATAGEPGLDLDDRELIRPGLSYTVDTLQSLRTDMPDTPLCLVMGNDVLAQIDSWHRWEELLDFAHIVTVLRPGFEDTLPDAVAAWVAQHHSRELDDLSTSLAGKIYHADLPLLDISGTRIRNFIANQHSPRYLLPEDVLRDINDLGIYRQSNES
jgi:nicotinate-nucleotide adenylyltransferase